ncbi:MAG: hypothetical protein WCA07_16885 [Gloeobacterales cyanobacterium]
MSAAILTPQGVHIAPTASLKPQTVQIGPFGRQRKQPRETPNLNFT